MQRKYILAWICLFDGMFSWSFWTKGWMVETNPLMLKTLELGPTFFAVVKIVQIIIAVILGWVIWDYAPKFKVAYWLVVAVYVGVYIRAVLSAF